MNNETVIKSSQEQAVASWIQFLNKLRIDELLRNLSQQDINLEESLGELEKLKLSIGKVVETNRGGLKGMHGFIAERMQVYIENARSLVEGAGREYFLIDDNGPVDYIGNRINFQQKFVQRNLSLDAIAEHLEKYPQYIKQGGRYQIPKDYYSKIKYLFELPETEAKKLSGEEYRLWRYIQNFFESKEIRFSDIESTAINYGDAQRGRAVETIGREERYVKKKDLEERIQIYNKSMPSLQEGASVAGVAALAEGGTAFCIGVYRKLSSGKKLSDFSDEDWKAVGIDTAKTTGKGGIRGAVVYTMANFTQTPAPVASAMVTAVYGMVAEAFRLKKGIIDQETFLIHSEVFSLDVTISAISSVLGQTVIPVPVLGAVIGNTVGMFMYTIAKDFLAKDEQEMIRHYNQQMESLRRDICVRHSNIVKSLETKFRMYNSLVELAFSEKVNVAFGGSIRLAEYTGVSGTRILRNQKDIEQYFTR